MRLMAHSTLLLFATMFALQSCGEFQSPNFYTAADATVTFQDGGGALLPDVQPIVHTCTIVPSLIQLPQNGDGLPLLTPALADGPYASFEVADAPSTVHFRWGVDGVLPEGLSFDESTGELQGIAAELGQRAVALTAESDFVSGTAYRCAPYELLIDVRPPCETDGDCGVDGFPDAALECNDDAFAQIDGGVCTYPIWRKDERCPVDPDRFQVWLEGAENVPASVEVMFTAVVEAHQAFCRETRFSNDDGGATGRCLFLAPEDPKVAPLLGYDEELVRIAYRLPWDYPAPLEEGQRYLFQYKRGPGWRDAHMTDGTLLVYTQPDDAPMDITALSSDKRWLVLAAHTGRVLPDDLLSAACEPNGVCPVVTRSEMAPTGCTEGPASTCGERTPMMLFLESTPGEVSSLVPHDRPAPLLVPATNRDALPHPRQALPDYAVHLAMSDSFVGDRAIDCAGADDEYRLSYFVLPYDACPFVQAGPYDDKATASAPTDLLVEVSTEFSPAGEDLLVDARVLYQPNSNASFQGAAAGLTEYEQLFMFRAEVPGLYTYEILHVPEEVDTPQCGGNGLVHFAVEPAKHHTVYLEISNTDEAQLQLLIGSHSLARTAFLGGQDEAQVASAKNPAPDWTYGPDGIPGRWWLPALPGGDHAGVDVFHSGIPEPGRYRVLVYRPPHPGEALQNADSRSTWRPPEPVVAHFRSILDRNLGTMQQLSASIPVCSMWEVGVLEAKLGGAMTFTPSDSQPVDLCDEDEVPVDVPFELP